MVNEQPSKMQMWSACFQNNEVQYSRERAHSRVPPNHCDLKPTEPIQGGYVATFSKTDVTFLQQSIRQITGNKWASCVVMQQIKILEQ
jgi:hypothetical protein